MEEEEDGPITLRGWQFARTIYPDLKKRVKDLPRAPKLDVLLVGDDPASELYVQKKRVAATKIGIETRLTRLKAGTSLETILLVVENLNNDDGVDGILIQLPLSGCTKTEMDMVLSAVDPTKDVDGFHPENAGLLSQGRPLFTPCTPAGVMYMLDEMVLLGMEAVVVGASNIVGRPMALLLEQAGATVTICHKYTRDLESHVRRAELLVSGTGVPHLIKGDWIQEGAVVIDVGITRMSDGSLRGDVEYEKAAPKCYAITPVPGGVGPMTVAMLLHNTVVAAEYHLG